MGWIEDILKEVPLSAVLKERIELAEQKYQQAVREAEELRQRVAALENEVEELRGRIPSEPSVDMNEVTAQVLVHLFREEQGDCDERGLAQHLQLELGVAKYHLEQLQSRGLATWTGDYFTGQRYWSLTSKGRRFVVENNLISM